MLNLFSALIETIGAGLKLAKSKNATKWNDETTRTLLEIQEEEAKGANNIDDAKLTRLRSRMEILIDAARNELILAASGSHE